MNDILNTVLQHPIISILSIIGSLCSIVGVLKIRSKRKNKLKKTKIKGDYIGGDKGSNGKADVENLVEDTEIGGDYIGGNDNTK